MTETFVLLLSVARLSDHRPSGQRVRRPLAQDRLQRRQHRLSPTPHLCSFSIKTVGNQPRDFVFSFALKSSTEAQHVNSCVYIAILHTKIILQSGTGAYPSMLLVWTVCKHVLIVHQFTKPAGLQANHTEVYWRNEQRGSCG